MWPDKTSNKILWTKTDQEPVLKQIKKKEMELAWTHIVRRNDDSIAKQALQ